jgi:hypothetical protein
MGETSWYQVYDHCDLCKKHGGAYTTHNTSDCCRFEKDGKEKSNTCATKKGSKKGNRVNQNFTQLTKKIKKLKKALKKLSKKVQKCQYEDSDSDSEKGVGLGSTRKVVKLGETIEKTKFTPPSPIKATPTTIACNSNDVSTVSVSKASDVMMTSPSQKEELLNTNSIITNKDPPEGKTTAIIAVMRGKPKHGHHHHCSNKPYKQKLVRVLLTSGYDRDLVFVDKDKPMLLPSSKRLVPVIGHGIGRKVSQLKWHNLLKASRWSKRRRSVVTRSYSHSISDGSEIQVC